MTLSIYVDDSAIAGPDLDTIQKETEAILKKVSGKGYSTEEGRRHGGA